MGLQVSGCPASPHLGEGHREGGECRNSHLGPQKDSTQDDRHKQKRSGVQGERSGARSRAGRAFKAGLHSLRQSLLVEKQRFDASVVEFWYLVGDDLRQHVREFHSEGFIHKGVETELDEALNHLQETQPRQRARKLDQQIRRVDASDLLHGVQQLGQLVEALPVLAGVLLPLDDGFSQLLDVRHPDLIEHRLALQTLLWDCTQTQMW